VVVDPVRGSSIVFQPPETYTAADATPPMHDWYGVNYGGTNWGIASFADPNIPTRMDYAYTASATANEMDAFTAWWTAIPYDPRKVNPANPPPVIANVCPA
jgi:hypothetical protein